MVNFEYDGIKYTMTEQEIEAAYRYQEHQYRLMDAKRYLNILAFGLDNESELEDDEVRQAKANFDNWYGTTYEEAIADNMLEEYVQRFEDNFDCNCDENTQWQAAILSVLRVDRW